MFVSCMLGGNKKKKKIASRYYSSATHSSRLRRLAMAKQSVYWFSFFFFVFPLHWLDSDISPRREIIVFALVAVVFRSEREMPFLRYTLSLRRLSKRLENEAPLVAKPQNGRVRDYSLRYSLIVVDNLRSPGRISAVWLSAIIQPN